MLDRRAPCVAFPRRVGSRPAAPAADHRGREWEPIKGSQMRRVGSRPAAPAADHRGREWEPIKGSHIRCLRVDRLWLAILASTLLFWAAPAYAVTVAIVRPLAPSPEMTETLVRLHGELLSVGLEVEIVEGPADRELGTSRTWLKKLAADHGFDAVIDIVGDGGLIAVEVWVTDKAPRRFEVSRVALEANTENASERLAIRALEVLRSNFLEIDLAARERRSEPSATPPTTTSIQGRVNQSGSYPERFGIEVGAAAVTSLDGVGPAVLPIMRFDWAARSWLVMQAALAGLGSRPTVATTAGNARVAQQYGVLGGCYRFRSDQRLRPFLALSAGVLRTSVEGQADLPKHGHSVDQWSFLLDGSLGAELPLGGRYYLTLAAHVHVAEPYVAIHFVDEVVATSGRPNLLLTLTVGAWL